MSNRLNLDLRDSHISPSSFVCFQNTYTQNVFLSVLRFLLSFVFPWTPAIYKIPAFPSPASTQQRERHLKTLHQIMSSPSLKPLGGIWDRIKSRLFPRPARPCMIRLHFPLSLHLPPLSLSPSVGTWATLASYSSSDAPGYFPIPLPGLAFQGAPTPFHLLVFILYTTFPKKPSVLVIHCFVTNHLHT